MKKQSAGILIYRTKGLQQGQANTAVEVLLGHAGGPFWAKKDNGAWSIPKGECDPDEDLETAARREFTEETGMSVPKGELQDLGFFKRKDGKVIYAWALEADLDATALTSNSFEIEWPPRSGKVQSFPEFDKAAWFPIAQAGVKMHSGQSVFIERLAELLGVSLENEENSNALAATETEVKMGSRSVAAQSPNLPAPSGPSAASAPSQKDQTSLF